MMKLLNIGGGSKSIPLPEKYKDYEHLLFDVCPEADYSYDLLDYMSGKSYYEPVPKCDVVYMSHILEHFSPRNIVPILQFIKSDLLVPGGTLDVRVPNVKEVMVHLVSNGMSLVDPLYSLEDGTSICTIDILYGHQAAIKKGNHYMEHLMAFDAPTLEAVLTIAGYENIEWQSTNNYFELNYTCQSSMQMPSNLSG